MSVLKCYNLDADSYITHYPLPITLLLSEVEVLPITYYLPTFLLVIIANLELTP